MNVLEKILEEISKVEKEYVTGHKVLYALGATGMATEISGIIRSHMDDVPDNNDGWIPVSEKLPEVGKMVKVTVHSSEWIADYDSAWVPEEEQTYHPEEYSVYDGYLSRTGEWKFYDEEFSEITCEKEFGTNKGMAYEVVTAWMPIEQPEPYKEEVNENMG
ncbi:DUF551 domain-containing protein [Mediterraneibacter gnavus]|uniref:DUF551 domain-containing protein n=1 Tax=Mediterraneibacter gnavus TaxID=33038 RepID=UPI00406852FD